MKRIEKTESLCPICLKRLPAEIWAQGQEVKLCRTCPDHGPFNETIWRGPPDFESWRRPKQPALGVRPQTETARGCPFDCGRCPGHGQHACTVLVEITGQCNLGCPVCFNDSGRGPLALAAETIIEWLGWIRGEAGEVVLQLSGGEPTLHPDLGPLVREAARLFPAVQLNTNGLILADSPALAEELAEAGLSWVFLQFDGTSDETFQKLRGRPLLALKKKAVENCAKAGLAVVLVATVAAGINDHELGPLLKLALEYGPAVRGLHLQPMTKSGRNPFPGPAARLTLPETLIKLHQQTGGLVRVEDAFPPSCEHERCSFQMRFRRQKDGALTPLKGGGQSSCKTTPLPSSPEETAHSRRRSVEVILNSWQAPPQPGPAFPGGCGQTAADAFDDFLAQARQEVFSLTAMAFQDVWTADLARLRGCCVHVFSPPGRLMPFCAYNLTAADGRPLHRR